jgi:hypothetical protein
MAKVLVMTATITPPENIPMLARRDPQVRLQDYCDALAFYLSVPSGCIDRVSFIDNSNSDVTALHRVVETMPHDKAVEIISFNGNDHPFEYGKCYGEFKLMDYGLAHSRFIAPDDVVWKITGRLRVLNLPRLVATAPADYAIYCDLRKIPLLGDRLGPSANQWMDPRFFSCKAAAYDRVFRDRCPELRADVLPVAPERKLYDLMMEARTREHVVPRFRVQPRYAGHGARMNVDYDQGAYRYKHMMRAALRRVAPWLWL